MLNKNHATIIIWTVAKRSKKLGVTQLKVTVSINAKVRIIYLSLTIFLEKGLSNFGYH